MSPHLHALLWSVAALAIAAATADLLWQRRRGRRDADAGAHRMPADVELEAAAAADLTVIDRRFAAPRPPAPVVVDLRGEAATGGIPQPRPGRHRRDEAGPAAVTMTGFMRELDAQTVELHRRSLAAIAAETGELPRVQA